MPNFREFFHVNIYHLSISFQMLQSMALTPNWKQIKQEHWIHFKPYNRAAMVRLLILKETRYDFLLNTPDGRWILGEDPEVGHHYFVRAGMIGNSLQGAGLLTKL